jgi:hypothetical protein
MLKIGPECIHFQRMLEKALLDGRANFFSACQKKFGHGLRGTHENRRRILHLKELTEPRAKRSGSLPPVRNVIISGYVLPNAFEEVTLNQCACNLYTEIGLNSVVAFVRKPI